MRLLAPLAAVALLALAAPAVAHEGNPDYESLVTRAPDVPGLTVQVVNGDDSLQLVNTGSEEVTVIGYEDEPYVRMRPDGVVEVNQNATATYLNQDRYSGADVPASVDPQADPKWKVVARNGRYAFHDHRIHWMNEKDPPKLDDKSKRQKVFDWKVPVRTGAATASIDGTLFWRGDAEGPSSVVYLGGGALLVAAIAFAMVVQRRRRREGAAPAEPREEAW